MIWAPINPDVLPVKADSELSLILTVTPVMPPLSPGAATQRTIPPKALRLRLSRACAVADERWFGVVVQKLKVIAGAANAAVRLSIAPSPAGAARAVAVPTSTTSRANIIMLMLDAEAWPPS